MEGSMEPRPSPVTDISDAALMERLAAGDVTALAPLHHRHARGVTSLVLRLEPAAGLEEAEDVSQEVFLTLWETAGRYQEEGRLRSWLYGIAACKARGLGRRERSRRKALGLHSGRPVGIAAPGSRIDDRLAAQDQVGQALASLPPKQREVLVLSMVEGLSGDEVAAILGIRTGAVWVRLHRARKRLEEALNALESGEEES